MRRIVTKPAWMKTNPDRVALLRLRFGTLTPLHECLLSMGGVFALVHAAEFDADNILSRGRLFATAGLRLKLGNEFRCHENVAELYAEGKGQICTGYALSNDGLWRQHSWASDRRGIVETTETRVLYFGYELTDCEAELFCYSQWYVSGECLKCGQSFVFNPDLVPSVRVSRQEDKWISDPKGDLKVFCATCIARANEVLAAQGKELVVVEEGAYGPPEVA